MNLTSLLAHFQSLEYLCVLVNNLCLKAVTKAVDDASEVNTVNEI